MQAATSASGHRPGAPRRFDIASAEFRRLADVTSDHAAGRVSCGSPVGAVSSSGIAQLAVRHRMGPPILEALAADAALTGQARMALQRRAATLRERSVLQARRTAEISSALTTAGVAHLVLKGAPLSVQLYGDLTSRHAKDIDLLVAPEELGASHVVLSHCGFSRLTSTARAPADDAMLRRVSKDETYVSKDGVVVELHWRLFHNAKLLPWCQEDMHADGACVDVGSVQIPVLSSSRNFVYLICHGADHCWFRLKWLHDIARLLHQEQEGLFEQVAALVRESAVDVALASTVSLCTTIFGTPVPAALKRRASSRAIRPVGDFCLQALQAPALQSTQSSLTHHLARLSYLWRLRENPRYRLSLVAGAMISHRDHQHLQLSRRSEIVYYLVRPFLIIGRRMSKAWTDRRTTAHQG